MDRTPLTALDSAPWNIAGGVDSDGCMYSVDEAGRMSVVGLDLLLRCPSKGCRVVLLPRHAELALSGGAIARLRKALAQVKEPPSAATRWALAVVAVRALGRESLGEPIAPLVGELFLRAAWEARSRAVLFGFDAGYRPRDPARARASLASLEALLEADPSQSPPIRSLDSLLADLEGTRARLIPLSRGQAPLARRSLLESLSRLARIERRLLARKSALLDARSSRSPRGSSDLELRDALARAWIRYGEPRRYESLLDELMATPGGAKRVSLIRSRLREERRFLGLAGAAFREASTRASGMEEARLTFLAGDCARRQGDTQRGRTLLGRARELAPESPAGRAAALLLEAPQ